MTGSLAMRSTVEPLEHFLGCWIMDDLDGMRAVLADDFVCHVLSTGQDHDAARYMEWRAADVAAMTVNTSWEDLLIDGEKFCVRLRLVGVHDGQLGQFAPTGRAIDYPVSYIGRIRGGKVAELWYFQDLGSLFHQIGVKDLGVLSAIYSG